MKAVEIAKKCFISLKNFQKTEEKDENDKDKPKLKEATLSIVANFLFPDKAILLNIFRIMDSSGDGQLGKDELKMGFKRILNEEIDEIELQKIMENVIQGKKDYIDYADFLVASIDYSEE